MTTKNNQDVIRLAEFWPYKAVYLADQISRITVNVARQTAQLNLSQWRVLAAIAETPDTTAAHVTSVTPMDKTIVSRAVQSLLTSELIKKSPDALDKRRMTLRTTDKGNEVYKAIAAQLRLYFLPEIEQDEKAKELLSLLDEFVERLNKIIPPEK